MTVTLPLHYVQIGIMDFPFPNMKALPAKIISS